MKNAVIYARFSSHGQNEMSIDGQIHVCRDAVRDQKAVSIIRAHPPKAQDKSPKPKQARGFCLSLVNFVLFTSYRL